MIRVLIMYPNSGDVRFDFDYYTSSHLDLVRKCWGAMGMASVEIDRGIAGGAGDAAPYVAMAVFRFESAERFGAAVQAHGAELMADIPNFTNATPRVQVSDTIA